MIVWVLRFGGLLEIFIKKEFDGSLLCLKKSLELFFIHCMENTLSLTLIEFISFFCTFAQNG